MDRLTQRLAATFRSLRAAPGFTATTVLTLALGIGLAAAVFTVADALLLRRLPVADQDRVVVLAGQGRDGRIPHVPVGLEAARELVRESQALRAGAWHLYEGAIPRTLRGEGDGRRLRQALVSGGFFGVLGADPVLGRAIRPEDDAHGAPPVMVLSHRAWRSQFGGAGDVVGRRVTVHEDGLTYTIVGVMPAGLDYPRAVDAWTPILAALPPEVVPMMAVDVVGRLAPGVPAASARDEMTASYRRQDSPMFRDVEGKVQPLPALVLGDTRPAVLAFAAASALLLLITCINVANLLLVRGLARVREVAVRTALGASRARVTAQLLAENAMLAVLGGALGVVVAAAAVRAFVAFAPADLPRLDEIRLDGTAIAAATGITALAMLLFGLAPALATSRVELQQALRSGARNSGSRRSRLTSELLVTGQVALAVLVLAAAGVIGRSLVRLQGADLAFEPERLLVAELAFDNARYGAPPQQAALYEQLLPAVQGIAGVRDATPVIATPFSGPAGWDGRPAAEGQAPDEAARNPLLNMEVVAPSYFATFGVPVVRGRAFTDEDRQGTTPAIVLSQSAARHYWPGQDPIGRRLVMGPPQAPRFLTVVGIVPDTRYRDLRDARPSIYFPIRQSFFPFAPKTLVLRTTGPSEQVLPALRRVLEERAPGVALANAAPFDSYLAQPLAQPRLNALLLAAFAAAAVALAAVGLFGVLATMVRQRTREFGVRLALGATSGDVGRLVLRRGLALATVGTLLGLGGAVAANRLLATLLFEVSPSDVPTLAAIALVLLLVATLASVLPARASTRVHPSTALRAE